jgi:hypothetical protein
MFQHTTASTPPMPTADTTRQLSTQTLNWLATHPHARKYVRSVWDKLTELQRSGQHRNSRRTAAGPDPSPTHCGGRCRACRRWTGRRRRFPCIVWHQIRGELLGQFTSYSRHRQSTART